MTIRGDNSDIVTEQVKQKDEDLSGLSRQLDLVESAMCLTLRHSVLSQQTGQITLI